MDAVPASFVDDVFKRVAAQPHGWDSLCYEWRSDAWKQLDSSLYTQVQEFRNANSIGVKISLVGYPPIEDYEDEIEDISEKDQFQLTISGFINGLEVRSEDIKDLSKYVNYYSCFLIEDDCTDYLNILKKNLLIKKILKMYYLFSFVELKDAGLMCEFILKEGIRCDEFSFDNDVYKVDQHQMDLFVHQLKNSRQLMYEINYDVLYDHLEAILESFCSSLHAEQLHVSVSFLKEITVLLEGWSKYESKDKYILAKVFNFSLTLDKFENAGYLCEEDISHINPGKEGFYKCKARYCVALPGKPKRRLQWFRDITVKATRNSERIAEVRIVARNVGRCPNVCYFVSC
ncbi:hypothetical protein L596_029488 [Steinernema carpocapsae]|uniref:Uncharacterized protein n=1 Tax=Steinernema carpocapsae TaxID=34508 RepID=A0A4U5LUS9_STECR|nr:hypothetical protein L596_029488 [Steinernema carpocapsae]